MSEAPRLDSDAPALADLSDPASFVPGVPHETFRWLREHDPVHWQAETGRSGTPKGPGYWALTRHADIAQVSKDPGVFSSEAGSSVLSDLPPRDLYNMQQQLIHMDPPRQSELRRLMHPHFKPAVVRRTEDHTRRVVREALDALDGREVIEFVEDVAAPISLRVLTRFLGVPDRHTKRFYRWTNQLIGTSDPEVSTERRGRLAAFEIFLYAWWAGRRRRKQPTEDIHSTLIHGTLDGKPLDRTQLGMNYFLLIVAGNETTRNALSGGVQTLCEHPDQLERLRREPALLPGAIEEMLRWVSPVMQFRRTALRDTRIGEQAIRAGEKLVVYYGAGNRDPAVFDAPETFDVTRSPNPHLAFGTGTHFCMGSHMARLGLRVAFEEMLERFPRLELAGPVKRLQSNFISGIKALPLRVR